MKILKAVAVSFAVTFACLAAETSGEVQGLDGAKIAARFPLIGQDRMQGFLRTKFTMDGCEAWVVEPETPAADGRWVWCMEWPTAFQDRVGVKALLTAGYRWVTFNPASKTVYAGNQNDAMIATRRAFQRFLVEGLGYAPKCGLIGMSWGGFYSVRYASIYPECVKAMFLDAPLLDFSTLAKFKENGWKQLQAYYPQITSDYVGADDPLQPVAAARAERIAKAGIPVWIIYGAADAVVPAESNCLRFAAAYEKAGGHLRLWRDNLRGHHPHGMEPGEGRAFVNFFNAAK